jgi:DNA repair protein RadC
MRYQRAETPARLDGHEAARRFFAHCFAGRPSAGEQLWVAHVDRQARCLALSSHGGTAGEVEIPVRQIIGDAARLGSAGILIAHNHPSGDSTPSGSDCRATRKLAAAAEAIDLTVVDHLVFGGDDCQSFRRMGLL